MKFLRSIFTLFAFALLFAGRVMAGPVDINNADAGSLAGAIDGVGERKAEAIIAYREAHGPFVSIDQLAEVKGIGMKTVDRNRANLTVSKSAR